MPSDVIIAISPSDDDGDHIAAKLAERGTLVVTRVPAAARTVPQLAKNAAVDLCNSLAARVRRWREQW